MNKNNKNNSKQKNLPLYVKAKYVLVRTGLICLIKTIGLDGLYYFGQFFGICEYLLQYKKRARIYRRLQQIYSHPIAASEARKIARQYFTRTRCDKMLYTIIDKIDRKELLSRFHIEGKQYIDESIKRGQGTFLMFSHQGSHHLAGIFLILSGYRIIGLRDPNESPLRIYVQQQFEKNFPEFRDLQITPNDSFARTFFHAFKDNQIVAAAMDIWRQRENIRSVQVEIFGQKRDFLSGMTNIALRSHSAILVGFVLSLPKFRYCVIFHPWLNNPDKDTDSPETVQKVMQKYANLIEQHVKKYPDHISKTK